MATASFSSVDDYIASFPADVRDILQRVRASIEAAVPGAEERIRYGMPAVMLGGRYAIHFAGWKKHVGIYPVSRADDDLEARIAPYRSGADSVNFPYAQPIPYDLIADIAAFLVAEHSGS